MATKIACAGWNHQPAIGGKNDPHMARGTAPRHRHATADAKGWGAHSANARLQCRPAYIFSQLVSAVKTALSLSLALHAVHPISENDDIVASVLFCDLTGTGFYVFR